MQVITTSYTVAEYCDQMLASAIVVNRDYQRTPSVWPPSARSYLIDTILLGYPVPKLSLYQKTDLKSRTTIKEIVDGQQRSQAILDFYEDKFHITGHSSFKGRRFSTLDELEQKQLVDYSLSADLITGASDEDIRQMFRRINSYTVPLNYEEHRHATNQGEFKWFVIEMTERYSSMLKSFGVFAERQLSRMQDARLFTELAMAIDHGVETYSKTKLDRFYSAHEAGWNREAEFVRRVTGAFDRVSEWKEIHNGPLMKSANFYSLILAVFHHVERVRQFGNFPHGRAARSWFPRGCIG